MAGLLRYNDLHLGVGNLFRRVYWFRSIRRESRCEHLDGSGKLRQSYSTALRGWKIALNCSDLWCM